MSIIIIIIIIVIIIIYGQADPRQRVAILVGGFRQWEGVIIIIEIILFIYCD